jgi:hypothetical protein
LQEREAQARPAIGRSIRGTILAGAGATWAAGTFACVAFDIDPYMLGILCLAMAALVFALHRNRRRRGQSNEADLVSTLQTAGAVTSIGIMMLLTWHSKVPIHAAIVAAHLLIGTAQITLILSYDRRLAWGIPYFFLSVVPLLLFPDYALQISGFLGGIGLVLVGLKLRFLGESDPETSAPTSRDSLPP